ncbi:MAG: hypothetical protein J5496_06915 [Lachnospiraceae bacterium]|nr:hypothetical protein [Lachnospiraceae bacterium]
MAREEEKKKNNHTGSKVVGGAILLALLGGGGYFGLGIGNPNGGALPINGTTAGHETQAPTQEETAPPTTAEETEAPTEANELVITVKESEILYQGKTVTLAELETAILSEFKDGKTVRLVDDKAIEAVYSDVSALLAKLNIPFEK